jgi:hypothetical protein
MVKILGKKRKEKLKSRPFFPFREESLPKTSQFFKNLNQRKESNKIGFGGTTGRLTIRNPIWKVKWAISSFPMLRANF